MSLQTAEHRSSQAEDRSLYGQENVQGLTPARRAALEALEREFAQLLKSAGPLTA